MKTENRAGIDFSQIISERFGDLTKSERRIANYLRKNQEASAFLSASELSDRLGLSEATVVRFARTMGFPSYPAMRTLLQDNFRQRVTHSARLRSKLDELRDDGDIFEQVTVSEIDYLTQALQTVDRNELAKAVEMMIDRDHIYVYGTGPSVTLIDLLNVRLTRFGKYIIPLTTAGREVLEPLLTMSSKDLLFAIGFFDVNPSLQIVLEHAAEVNCPVILLTDTLGSIIGDKANVILEAKRGAVSAFHSLVVPMTIINTLLLAIANQDQTRIIGNLDELDQLRNRLQNFVES